MPTHDSRITTRRGITLMEVLIAIGILSIGLTSVAALIPAGGSQARKAIISDRAANLAENALADAVTSGLTNPSLLSNTSARIIVDPAGNLDLSIPTVTSLTQGAPLSLFARGRDDVVFAPSDEADGLPKNLFVDGTRAFDGRTTCLWAIETLDGNSIAPGKLARLSVIVFHDRATTASVDDRKMSATVDSTGRITGFTLPTGRTVRDAFRSGTVIVVNSPSGPAQTAFFGMRSASLGRGTNNSDEVYGVFDQQPPAGAITVLLDSVGLAQSIVTLEGPGPFSSTVPREVVP